MNVTFRFCFRSPLKSLKLPVFKGLSTDLGSHSFLHISFYPLYNGAHYTDVIAKIANVKHHLWIGTADIKDLYVKSSSMTVPFLKVISRLIERGVEVRLIHAKEPGPNFRKDFDDYSILAKRLERVLCPRVHFKMVIFDLETAYVGSANLTGAGLGMKGERNRNFEAGVLTNAPSFVEQAINQFDFVWNGSQCKKCGRKRFCPDSPLKY